MIHKFLIIYFYLKRDRIRTPVNVWGDAIGAGIVDHLSKKEIRDAESESSSSQSYSLVSTTEQLNSDLTENQV